ncbi:MULTISPECIES: fimbrial protein [unclassified Acinetobacter]|uniref:fimbrial protein n=1 Tax=unclassified Acinetobacter TaxID=196816 RepID=UPI0015D30EE9|nr:MULTISPECIES: fimbrial protein [unclassified Acinetobacter]
MKLKHLLLAGVAAGAANMAMAATSGTITFTGQVVADTCDIFVNGGPGTTVTLPTVQKNTLAVSGNRVGQTDFTLNIMGCGAAVDARGITLTLTPNSYDTTNNDFLANTATGAAPNVAIELSTGEGVSTSAIAFGGAPYVTQPTISSGAASLDFSASYVATGVADAGAVSHVLGWNIVYN